MCSDNTIFVPKEQPPFVPELSWRWSVRSQFKQAIMAAFQRGQITAEEAEDWIVLNGLTGA